MQPYVIYRAGYVYYAEHGDVGAAIMHCDQLAHFYGDLFMVWSRGGANIIYRKDRYQR